MNGKELTTIVDAELNKRGISKMDFYEVKLDTLHPLDLRSPVPAEIRQHCVKHCVPDRS